MTHDRARLIERILGPERARGGAHALLGLDENVETPVEAVVEALRRSLALIEGHPESDTAAGQEVRLALHAASVRLLRPSGEAGPSAAPERSPRPAPRSSKARALLHRDVVLSLGMYGGWNARSLHRLARIAHARGVSSGELAGVVREIAGHRSSTPKTTPRPRRTPSSRIPVVPLPAVSPASSATSRREDLGVWIIFGVVASLLALSIPLWVAAMAKPGAPDRERVPEPSPPVVTETPPEVPAPVVEAAPVPRSFAQVLNELRTVAEGPAGADDAWIARFDALNGEVAERWVELGDGELIAALGMSMTIINKAAGAGADGRRLIEALLGAPIDAERAPADVRRRVWAAGVAHRLGEQVELPASLINPLRAAQARLFDPEAYPQGGAFVDGASAAAVSVGRELVRQPPGDPREIESWKNWIEIVDRLERLARTRDSGMLSNALGLLLESPATHAETTRAQVVHLLVGAIDWSEGAPARAQALSWFDSPTVGTAALSVLTTELALASSAPDVGPDMTLASAAPLPDRQALRARYARSWALDAPNAGAPVLEAWIAARDAVIADGEHDDPLAQAVALAYLANAAAAHLGGRDATARDLIDAARRVALSPGAYASPAEILGLTGPGSDTWALRYLRAGVNIPEREALLAELARRDHITDPVVGDLVATEALRGSPASVRRAATDLVLAFADEPAVVNGVLEQLPHVPRTRENSRTISTLTGRTLPAVDHESWEIEARRAVVERALDLVAPAGYLRRFDELAEDLGAALAQRATLWGLPNSGATIRAEELAEELYEALITRTMDVPHRPGVTPAPTHTRRSVASTAALGGGPMQRFVLYESACVRVIAYELARDHPHLQGQVNEIVTRLLVAMHGDVDVVVQVRDVERAMADMLELAMLEAGA